MPEMQKQENESLDVSPEEKESTSQTVNIPKARSHESLWGALLLAVMLIFVAVSVVSIGWGVYSNWKSERVAKAEPSITVLSEQSSRKQDTVLNDDAKIAETKQPQPSEEKANVDVAMAVKKIAISVFNGGAIKGNAGILTTFLKAEGYVSVSVGNTLKDYTGVTLYYAAGLENEAGVIKASVIKKYPDAKILPVDTTNKETASSPVTIILGK